MAHVVPGLAGPPPLGPDGFDWTNWHADPTVAGGLVVLGVAYALATMWRHRFAPEARVEPRKVVAFAGALGVLFIALTGPVHDLSDYYLFSAHMIQHMLLVVAMPPLLLYGTPGVGCSTGRSAGMAPFKTLSTRRAPIIRPPMRTAPLSASDSRKVSRVVVTERRTWRCSTRPGSSTARPTRTRTATPSASPPSWSTARSLWTAATTPARAPGVCSGEGRDLLPLFMARANRHRTEPLQQLDDLAMADRRPRRPNIR
jgi:hypothetical protein